MSSTIPNKERQNRVTFAIDLEKPNAQAQAHLLKVEDCKDAVQNLSASLERFEVFGVDDHWCREKCEFIYEMLENWVDLLPTAHDLTGKWPTVHEFLIQHNALGPWSPKEPGVLTDSGVYLLLFAISNLLWKRLCEPLLVGATAEQRLLLKTTHNDLPMRDERTRRDPDSKEKLFWTIASSEVYSKQLKTECRQAANLIADLLKAVGFTEKHFDDDEYPRSMVDHIHQLEMVARPMANLATKVQCSGSEYIWSWKLPRLFVRKHHLNHLELLDLDTRCMMRKPAAHFSALSDNDPLAWAFFPLFPMLCRVVGGGKPAYPVSKGVVAVKFLEGYDAFQPPKHAISDAPAGSEYPLNGVIDQNR